MPVEVRAKKCGGGWRRGAARLALCASLALFAGASRAQENVPPDEAEFGPVVRAYLGYLRAEQLVTDDRASRREVSSAYVRRNSNRVRALRQMAIRIARESKNDYLPELYAVARDELGTLFETPPRPETFREGEVFNETFRYLGPVRTGELFYLFARLDVYEQSELLKQHDPRQAAPRTTGNAPTRTADSAARPADAETRPNNTSQPDKPSTGDAVKTSTAGAAQANEARRGGAQSSSAPPPADAQQSAPATRPRRVPPPAAEPPTKPVQQ